MQKYKFPPMLGPASAHPVGSRAWAECLGNELDYKVERAAEMGVEGLVPLIRATLSASPPPWQVWPEPPCMTVDAYFELCTGLSYEQLWTLIDTYKSDHGLARSLDVARANEQAATVQPGKPRLQPIHDAVMNSKRSVVQGNSRSYLLRRIAREAPQVLEAFERHEHASVRAAADAAGIPKRSRVPRLRGEWKHSSIEEREEFLAAIAGDLAKMQGG